ELPRPPTATLFPYTTLFRSERAHEVRGDDRGRDAVEPREDVERRRHEQHEPARAPERHAEAVTRPGGCTRERRGAAAPGRSWRAGRRPDGARRRARRRT